MIDLLHDGSVKLMALFAVLFFIPECIRCAVILTFTHRKTVISSLNVGRSAKSTLRNKLVK